MRFHRCIGALLLVGCNGSQPVGSVEPLHTTTSGSIAIANLDGELEQAGLEEGVEELLLARARFLGDYDALDRASVLAEGRSHTGHQLLRRARVRSAVHRFADALADLAAAEDAGASREACAALRASILVALGRGSEVVSQLEADLARQPGFSTRSALAGAYAAVGRLEDAERLYADALADLHTTSPFPFAWLYFARATMWLERAGDRARAEELLRRALWHLPEFVPANIHLAELEAERGDLMAATARVERVVATREPEALSLLGELHMRSGNVELGRREIAEAQQRFESLLARHPAAFADHAAEFYLGPGANAERAWELAMQNLALRPTDRAFSLAIEAARSTGRHDDLCALVERGARWTPECAAGGDRLLKSAKDVALPRR